MLSGHGIILVANVASTSVSLIDENNYQKIKDIAVDFEPHEVVVTPSGKLALVSNFGDVGKSPKKCGRSISIIDIEKGDVCRTIMLPQDSRPHGICCISDSQALVTCQGIQSLVVIDYLTGEIDHTIKLPGAGAHMVTVDKARRYAYIGNMDSGTVLKVDLKDRQTVIEMKIGKSAEGVTLTNDGKRLLVTAGDDHELVVLDAEHLSIIKRISTGWLPVRAVLFNHGQCVAVANAISGTVKTYDLAIDDETGVATYKQLKSFKTTELCRFSFTNGRLWGIALHVPINIHVRPDQKTAYITNLYAGNVALVNLEKGELVNTFTAAQEPDGIDISYTASVVNL